MSKKWGTNSKAQQKRAKEKSQKQEVNREKEQKKQAAKWKDQQTDKYNDKQKQKQREREQQLRKKEQKRKIQQQEQKQMVKLNKKAKFETEKMTVAQIAKKQLELEKGEDEQEDQIEDIYNDIDETLVDAHTVEEALGQMTLETVDKHPEKRVKAAWMKYVDDNLPRIKKQNTGMKRTQHLNMLREEWKKAPENPFNQRVVSYNTKI